MIQIHCYQGKVITLVSTCAIAGGFGKKKLTAALMYDLSNSLGTGSQMMDLVKETYGSFNVL